MIESISISAYGSFADEPQILSGLSHFNYLFGSNATGKTTISRVIADEAKFPKCSLTWRAGTKLQTMVYNHDFVERNFVQSVELKGVFTLGDKQIETLAKIATGKGELDALTKSIEHLTQVLSGAEGTSGKHGELADLEADFKEKCWAQKQKHDAKFKDAFEGYRNNAEKFKVKVLEEKSSNVVKLQSQADLEKRAETIFGPAPTREAAVPAVDTAKLIAHETNPILKKRVIGKDDVDIAAMISKLGNSDWVREGWRFYDVNDGSCPFCQQTTTEAFAKSLKEYFDETFDADRKAIELLVSNYTKDANRLQQQLSEIIAAPSRFLEVEKLKTQKQLLVSKIALNKQRLEQKLKEASQSVVLESIGTVVQSIEGLIKDANSQVLDHNSIAANLDTERATLTSQVWRLVLDELKTELVEFEAARDDLNKAIAAITTKLATTKAEKVKKTDEIRELERQTTSVQPTIDEINKLLESFGFQGFELAKAASGTSYELVRPDGTDAKETLSEGEKTFVSFLYFYHLLKGSESDSGITNDRIVVFDDPVSSLDSDILFIIGSLIKGLCDEVRAGTGHIKQVFVLTHNIYFHKELTFSSKRRGMARNEETFWIVRKPWLFSTITKYPTNPIKTSYELLWAEVRNPDRSNLGIQNTLRRILDTYFKILGGMDFEALCAFFEGKDKLICKSLCSWMHDGSHYAHDDLYMSIDDSMVANYLRVFRAIFEMTNHIAHYEMMMGDAPVKAGLTAREGKTVPAAVPIATA